MPAITDVQYYLFMSMLTSLMAACTFDGCRKREKKLILRFYYRSAEAVSIVILTASTAGSASILAFMKNPPQYSMPADLPWRLFAYLCILALPALIIFEWRELRLLWKTEVFRQGK